MKRIIPVLTLLLTLGLALGAGLYALARWDGRPAWTEVLLAPLASRMPVVERQPPTTKDAPETAMEHALKHLDPKYTCPMHPQIIRDESGTCPICGMDLVPVKQTDDASTNGTPTVSIPAAMANSLGVRTATVEKGRLWRRIDTVGYVDYDETLISHVHTRTDGWVERLWVKSTGERFEKGQRLLELYSPELVNAQEEFLQALRLGKETLIRASRERLAALAIPKSQVSRLARKREAEQRVDFYATQDGVVSALNIREGMYVTPATEIMTLADLSTVWVVAEVFEKQAGWVRPGQAAEVRLSYLPGRVWEGSVEYVYPELESDNRTLRARLRFENPDETLKPNMFADVTIYGGAKIDVLSVPREALILTGRGARVILDVGDGRFQPRDVVPGIETGDWVEIISGLEAGERVVTSAQFLIDSEASIKATLMRLQEPGG